LKLRHKKSISYKNIHLVLCLFFGIFIGGCGWRDAQNLSGLDQDSVGELHILFIGNSYTFYNDLPEMVEKLARAGGHQVNTATVAEGGWTLDDHAQSSETFETIQGQTWEYVVLQEQSVIPTDPAAREHRMVPAIQALNTEIERTGAKTILFMTWGRREGLLQSGFRDFKEMQAALTDGYVAIADELDVRLAPVGAAWEIVVDDDPQIDLWKMDGSHPSVAGSYLAACVFYAVIFQESPEGLAYMAGLEADTVLVLQSMAAETVLRDLERWHIE
jgi:hypothetical protein